MTGTTFIIGLIATWVVVTIMSVSISDTQSEIPDDPKLYDSWASHQTTMLKKSRALRKELKSK